MPSLVEIGLMILEKMNILKDYRRTDRQMTDESSTEPLVQLSDLEKRHTHTYVLIPSLKSWEGIFGAVRLFWVRI